MKLFWIILFLFLGGCASQLEKIHTLKHLDGRTVECTEPGNASIMAGGLLGKALWDKEFKDCMEKYSRQGFIEEAKK